MVGLSRWCYRHRRSVVLAWIGLLVGLTLLSHSLGTRYSDEFSLPGTDSTAAMDLLRESGLADRAGDSGRIVLHAKTGALPYPATEQALRPALEQIAALPSVGRVVGPYDSGGGAQMSPDGATAFVTVEFTGWGREMPMATLKAIDEIAASLETPTLQAEFGGNAASQLRRDSARISEIIGFSVAALVLFFAFGSLLAMVLPLIVAVLALGAAHAAIGLLSHVLPVGSMAPSFATLIGLGVAIDYALFIVTRHRAGLRSGMAPEDASTIALNTAGRAVIFAGGTVAVALLGLLVLGVDFLSGMGIASGLMIAFAVVATITLLPAMFGFAGLRVFPRKERRSLAAGGLPMQAQSPRWERLAHRVERDPLALGIVALAAVLLLVAPTLTLRMGSSDQGNDPAGWSTRAAYDLMAAGFGPGANGPLLVAAKVPDAASEERFDALVQVLRFTEGVAFVGATPPGPDPTVKVLTVVPLTSPQDAATTELVHRIRDQVVPSVAEGTALAVHVGGTTAVFADFGDVLNGKLPLFLGVVVLLGCLLLMLAFRSIVIPLTAAVMNVLSACAGIGVVVVIFQWGWGSEALNLGAAGPVESFLPVMMLAILFGLSMDYQVFLVSRMHEEWLHSKDNARAVRVGQVETSRVITAAATIMVCVFLAFVLTGVRAIAEFGLGLATAILIDALVLRTVLVPAAMHLFGPANWWLPRWLDRLLPHLSVEGPAAHEAPPPPAAIPVQSGVVDLRGAVRCHSGAVPGWAVVSVQDATGAEIGRAATGADGRFALPVPRRDGYTLLVRSPGHVDAERSVAAGDRVDVILADVSAQSKMSG
ncbi:MAG: MMPL family transporter [Sporichthyaceae bacterium]